MSGDIVLQLIVYVCLGICWWVATLLYWNVKGGILIGIVVVACPIAMGHDIVLSERNKLPIYRF